MEEPHSASQLSDPETWVDRHGDYLYSNALLRLRNRELAEEMVQETFLAALKGRDRFAGQSSERTWLVGILKNKIVDHFRRSGREQGEAGENPLPFEEEQLFDREGDWVGHWRVEAGLGPQEWGASPDEDLERKEFWQVLERCLKGLPVRLARVFNLREIDGIDSEQICKILDVTATNLWVMLHRCRMQLRRCIEVKWFQVRERR